MGTGKLNKTKKKKLFILIYYPIIALPGVIERANAFCFLDVKFAVC